MSDPTLRWRGAVAATVVLAVAGLVTAHPVVLLSALVPLTFVAYGSATTVDLPVRADGTPALVATRRLEPSPAPPGRPVTVTLTVRNDSEETLSDVRVVDGVPADLAVTRGSPRTGTTLEPGEEATVRYVLIARRGEHHFAPPMLRVRSPGAGAVETVELAVSGDRELICRLDADAPPLDEHANRYVGQLTTDSPGRGLEFHSTREYHHGDDASRIDWRHYAKRGTLATINYQEHRSATVLAVVDARAAARVVAGPGRPTAVELEAYAATHAVTEFLRAGHDVGVAVVGTDGPGPAGLHWLPGGSGADQRNRAMELLRTAAAGPDDDDGAEDAEVDALAQVTKVMELAAPGTQLALFSPMLDDLPVRAVETWRAHEYPVVVLSPDVVTANTVSGQYEQVRRRTRLARTQAAGARTIDWRRGTPLPIVLEYAFAADVGHAATATVGHGAGGDR